MLSQRIRLHQLAQRIGTVRHVAASTFSTTSNDFSSIGEGQSYHKSDNNWLRWALDSRSNNVQSEVKSQFKLSSTPTAHVTCPQPSSRFDLSATCTASTGISAGPSPYPVTNQQMISDCHNLDKAREITAKSLHSDVSSRSTSAALHRDYENNPNLPVQQMDVLVVGCGIGGCATALTLADKGINVTMLSASPDRNESNSYYAQGGIIYTSDADSPALLAKDVFVAGAGISEPSAVFQLARDGPSSVDDLLLRADRNIDFDKKENDKDKLAVCKEAAHSCARIIHCKDHTGKAIMERLTEACAEHENITLLCNSTAMDLIMLGSECTGAYVMDNDTHEITALLSKELILATGGLGDIYEHTSNPSGSRGDGIAMAARAGAQLENMEYVQFHPTSLYVEGGERFLLTEALRGEGAQLLSPDTKEPFMEKYHPKGTLAPRDIVSRGVFAEMKRTNSEHVWLDISHRGADWIRQRFPSITEECAKQGFDITTGPIPCVPCAHYACGGISVDSLGRTSVPRLRAVGEVTCTGLHGGNRLASTSLLEAIVWGKSDAEDIFEQLQLDHVKEGDSNPTTSPLYKFPSMNHLESISQPYIHSTAHRFHTQEEKKNVTQLSDEFVIDSNASDLFAAAGIDKQKKNESLSDLIAEGWLKVKRLMWENVGITRDQTSIDHAISELKLLKREYSSIFNSQTCITPETVGLTNAIQVALIIANAASSNQVSIGAHYRSDSISTWPAQAQAQYQHQQQVKHVDTVTTTPEKNEQTALMRI